MKLPHAELAEISEKKIYDYLLSSTHWIGRSKARYFLALGFNAETLIAALKQHALDNSAILTKENKFGKYYDVEGPLQNPNGKFSRIHSIWFIEMDTQRPRLATAYPSKL